MKCSDPESCIHRPYAHVADSKSCSLIGQVLWQGWSNLTSTVWVASQSHVKKPTKIRRINRSLPHGHAGPRSAPKVRFLLRAVILGLHWHGHLTYKVIGEVFEVMERTASDIICKVKVWLKYLLYKINTNYSQARAADSNDFHNVLACLDNECSSGLPPKTAQNSEASIVLRDLLGQGEARWRVPFENIAGELGVCLARSTLGRVFHDHHDIFRRKGTHKPSLNASYMEAWLAFAHLALHIAMNHIVFTDETWVEFNSIRRAFNLSRKRRRDPNEWALHNIQVSTIWVMLWGTICMRQWGPCHIWEHDTEEDQMRHRDIIDEAYSICLKRQETNQAEVAIPGTWQHTALEEINRNIDHQNEIKGRIKRRQRCHRSPHQEFKEEHCEHRSNGGINWVTYRERIFRGQLYPGIEEIQARTGIVWVLPRLPDRK